LTDGDAYKRAAAERAVGFVESGMRIGLGTGSTARHVLDVLAERLGAGHLSDVVGVPTSRATEEYAENLDIPLTTLDDVQRLDLTIDGADEVDPHLDLIKGLGGALLWEKIVATVSDRLVVVVDGGKRVTRLGERAPVPVEVVPFGWRTHLEFFAEQGADATRRTTDAGAPVVTDGGHYLVDCRFEGGIADAAAFERALCSRVGIVESGLFLGIAAVVVVCDADGIHLLERGRP